MITILYQLLCAYLVFLICRQLLGTRAGRQQKAVMAFMLIPLILRALLIK